MGMDATTRRGRAHLRLVPEADEWPEDLLPFLERARERMLAGPAPSPSPEVLSYLEEPAYGKVDGEGTMVVPADPEPFELEALSGPSYASRRRLVTIAGAAAALTLVALGLRPVLMSSPEVREPAVAPAAPTTVAPTSAAPSAAAAIGSLDQEVPATRPATTSTAATSSVAPPTDPVTVPAAAPTVAATVTTPKPPTSAKPAPKPTPAPAPVPVPSPSEVVLAYFHVANARGRCVADQPASANRAQLIAACGAEPVPPPNLVQFWAARDIWLDCAQPLLDRDAGQAKITDRCGAKPERAAYDVPANPYSISS
jgi:hypothetical protein